MRRTWNAGIVLGFIIQALTFAPPVRAQQKEAEDGQYKVIEELDVKVEMRDGVRLSTNIYRPDSPGKFPVLLERTPYGNGGAGNGSGHFFARHGYVVLIQDCRGRYESEGVFDPFQTEAEDGYDSQQWAGAQAWCDGKLGTFGGSYVGFTQWMPAPLGSPYLVTMLPVVTFSDFHDMVYYGGAARMRLFSGWSFEMSTPFAYEPKRVSALADKVYLSLPLISQDYLLGWKIPFLRDWLSHPEHDRYWDRTSLKDNFSKIKASVYNVGGWFDICQHGTLENFAGMTSAAIDPALRGRQRLMIGPWVHSFTRDGKVGELDFGKEAVVNLQDFDLRWFDSQLKGLDNGILAEDPVRIFVMGRNIWRGEKEWPLARTRYTDYYFHSGGGANSAAGDGSLDTRPPKTEKPDRYVYDPAHYVPSSPDGPYDQAELEKRSDILVFTSAPLAQDLEVTGPVKATVYAASSASNTDFTAKLVDVYPDGRAMRICDGIIRASFRDGNTRTSNIQPGKVYGFNIDLWATSNVFLKGHRVRVEVSSSSFPRFDRNLNTGGNFALDSTFVSADQTVYHSSEYASRITLPVIE